MKKFFRAYFSFNQVELKGIRLLLILLVALVLFYLFMPLIFKKEESFDFSTYEQQVTDFLAQANYDTLPVGYKKKQRKYTNNRRTFRNGNNQINIEPFDPNGLPISAWVELGLSKKQAESIKKFEAKGGRFYYKEDLKKLYVISDWFYDRIEPYIQIQEFDSIDQGSNLIEEPSGFIIDVNQATKEDFMQIEGVKEYLADRIVKYRSKLGGFHSINQLKEVKYLSQFIFNKMMDNVRLSNIELQKIRINYSDFSGLVRHPYINKELANNIIDYRKRVGFFESLEGFKKSGLVNDSIYTKLVPYLDFAQ